MSASKSWNAVPPGITGSSGACAPHQPSTMQAARKMK
jgi:hypothetical protein